MTLVFSSEAVYVPVHLGDYTDIWRLPYPVLASVILGLIALVLITALIRLHSQEARL